MWNNLLILRPIASIVDIVPSLPERQGVREVLEQRIVMTWVEQSSAAGHAEVTLSAFAFAGAIAAQHHMRALLEYLT